MSPSPACSLKSEVQVIELGGKILEEARVSCELLIKISSCGSQLVCMLHLTVKPAFTLDAWSAYDPKVNRETLIESD
jgi:hypothetical protein